MFALFVMSALETARLFTVRESGVTVAVGKLGIILINVLFVSFIYIWDVFAKYLFYNYLFLFK